MSETRVKVDQALLKKLMMEQECTSGKFEGHRAASNEGRLAATGFYVGFRCEKCKQMVWLDRDKVMDREPDPKATPPIGIDFGYDGPLAGFWSADAKSRFIKDMLKARFIGPEDYLELIK